MAKTKTAHEDPDLRQKFFVFVCYKEWPEEDDAILGIPYICVPSSRNDFFLSLKRYTTPAEGPSVD